MRKCKFSVVLVLLLAADTLLAQGNNPLITVLENGMGTLLFPGSPAVSLPCVPTADPGPGGLPNALTCNLLGPPSLVAGDLLLTEGLVVSSSQQPRAASVISDIIRFNPAGTGAPAYPASLLFYSDQDDIPLLLADTGLPAGLYTNTVTLAETILPGGANGIVYTPTANQPGFIAGFSVTYNLISDVPEPASASLLVIAGGMLLAGRRRWKARAK